MMLMLCSILRSSGYHTYWLEHKLHRRDGAEAFNVVKDSSENDMFYFELMKCINDQLTIARSRQ